MSVGRLIDLASAGVVVLAIVAGAATLISTRHRLVALAVLLDLLTAAGLLHLAADPTYARAASATIVLAVRRLITWGLANEGDNSTGVGSRVARLGRWRWPVRGQLLAADERAEQDGSARH